MRHKTLKILVAVVVALGLAGCTVILQKGRKTDLEKIDQLNAQVSELETARQQLEQQLSQEIKDKQVKLEMLEKGLVITFLADILFDSGKAKIKSEAFNTLDKISTVLQDTVPNLSVGIEGHTDNQPIQFSGWKSNWELSTARALSVLHYIVDEKNIAPERVSAIGYGEYRSVAGNDTKDGRQQNRRVEIVIMPTVTKVKEGQKAEPAATQTLPLAEPAENLK